MKAIKNLIFQPLTTQKNSLYKFDVVQNLILLIAMTLLFSSGINAQFNPDQWYRLTTEWQGVCKSLDIKNSGQKNKPVLAKSAMLSGQYWKITPIRNTGYYRLSTKWQGEDKCLDIKNDGQNNKPVLATKANVSGQYWKITPIGNTEYYRLSTKWQGDGKCLDIINDSHDNKPELKVKRNVSGQYWKITKTSTSVGKSSDDFNHVCFDLQIHKKMKNKVKGYAVVIVNKEGIQAKVSGGWAQAPNDGKVPMKTNISSNIASVTKCMGAIALLNLINKHQLADKSVEEQLDMPIWKKLPPKWHSRILNSNKKLTYRHFLQHKSGIPNTTPPPNSGYSDKILYMMTKCPSQNNRRKYSNFHYSIFTFLVPAIAYPKTFQNIHNKNKNKNIHEYSRVMRQETEWLFKKYLEEEIFPKVGGGFNPTCDPVSELPKNKYAKHYTSKNDKVGNIKDNTSEGCKAVGGYYLTAQELANFTCTFAFTNEFLGPKLKKLLYIPTTSEKDNRLVYAFLKKHQGFKDELNQLYWTYQGGDAGGYHAVLFKLPYDYYGIGLVNSHIYRNTEKNGSSLLARYILDTFYEATR